NARLDPGPSRDPSASWRGASSAVSSRRTPSSETSRSPVARFGPRPREPLRQVTWTLFLAARRRLRRRFWIRGGSGDDIAPSHDPDESDIIGSTGFAGVIQL